MQPRYVLSEMREAPREADVPPLCVAVREARIRAGLNQEQAAAKVGMSVSGYRAYETRREPSPRRLRQIAEAFGVSIDDLLVPVPSVSEQIGLLVEGQARMEQLLGRVLALLEHRKPVQVDEPAPDSG